MTPTSDSSNPLATQTPAQQAQAKQRAADAAVDLLRADAPGGGTLGLGTGSTAKLFVDALARLIQAGTPYRGVPTSQATRRQAEALAIPLMPDEGDDAWDIVWAVDGADEVDPQLNVIKGGGGALTREKIVNFAARKNVLIVDESKLSARLGDRWPVPVEVLRFGHGETARKLGQLGRPTLRLRDGQPFLTDAGNYIYDVALGPIADPAAADHALGSLTGVVETGLFVQRADIILVAGLDAVRVMKRAVQ